MAVMKRARRVRGAPPKNTAPTHYDQLMKQGMGNSEACQIVGISRTSVTRWGHGHTAIPGQGSHKVLADLTATTFRLRALPLGDGTNHPRGPARSRHSVQTIARVLGRSPSTVNREIQRNTHHPSGNYRPQTAQCSAEHRRSRPLVGRIAASAELTEFVGTHLLPGPTK